MVVFEGRSLPRKSDKSVNIGKNRPSKGASKGLVRGFDLLRPARLDELRSRGTGGGASSGSSRAPGPRATSPSTLQLVEPLLGPSLGPY